MRNITNISQPVSGVTHPMISDIYLKKNIGDDTDGVLVIEARKRNKANGHVMSEEEYQTDLLDLLIDLEDVKKKAEDKVGRFERIDIRRA